MKTLQGIAVALLTSTLVACALDSVDRGGKVTIRIAAPNREGGIPVVMTSASPAPTSVSAFSCIGVNVLGPGIPDTSRNPEPNLPLLFDRLLRRESYCSYRGIIKGPISATATTDQEISLIIPPGSPRLIQVVGIIEKNGSNDCQAEFIPGVLPPVGPSGTPLEGDAYELGRAVVDLFQDQTVSITMDYNSLTTDADRAVRELKCGTGPNPSSTPSGVPTVLLAPVPLTIPAPYPTHLAAGGGHVCGIFGASSTVYCRGANTMGQLGDGTFVDSPSFIPISVSGALKVATGNAFSCALLSGGTVKCWGAGLLGQLGDSNGTNSNTPVNVTGISSITSIAAGGSHACAQNGSNALYCWGANASGQLGDGTTTNRNMPIFVSGVTSFAISLGLNHSCAATSSNVMCWGNGASGQLGTGAASSSLTPVTATGVSGSINYLAVGENHSCAIVSGTLYCWGSNVSGQIGNGGGGDVLTPTTIPIGSPNAITAGKDFSCAKDGSSALYCWGIGPMLGNGTFVGNPSPTGVSSLTSNVYQLHSASISGTVCVTLNDGSTKCWGNNTFGQIYP